jgi:Peptidase family M28
MTEKGRRGIPFMTTAVWVRLALLALIIGGGGATMIGMPGKSNRGPIPPLGGSETLVRIALQRDVETLAGSIGERNLSRYTNLLAAADFLEASFASAGYAARRQSYSASGKNCDNIEAEITGADRADEIVLIGGHYDSIEGSPGANDNATGAAAVLALARAFAEKKTSRTLRFVAFVNEEPPYYRTPAMGSVVYARRARERGEKIVAMLSLETIGYYSEAEGSQHYLFPLNLFYPSTGNFIGFVGNLSSRRLVRRVVGSFRGGAVFPSEGAALPGFIMGVGWSDQWSFWREGYPAVMVTDTALFRYPYYHSDEDTPDKVRYEELARVVTGLQAVVADLAGHIVR